MSLAYESRFTPDLGFPFQTAQDKAQDTALHITVVFTSVEATVGALRQAGVLANRLDRRIDLVVTQVVPYPLPLSSPPVLLDWNERRFRAIAADSPVETKVLLYLCRDRLETLIDKLRPHSVVIIGGRKRWWPTSEARLARALRKAGHEVVFRETE